MPRVVLSQSFVKRIRCPDGRRKIDYFDAGLAGFLLEVRRSGGKTFYQRYRDSRGRERQFKIGSPSFLSAAQARKKARSIVAAALLGSDPQAERQELRSVPTLAEFVKDSYLPFARNAKRSWRTDETVLRIHVLPRLGSRPLDLVTNHDVAELVRTLQGRGYSSGTTNRVLVLLRYVFNLARKWGVPRLGENPTLGLKTLPDVCRERFLTDDEAHRLLAALESDENQVAAQAIKLLLLTGARRNEITYAKWDYIDWEKKTLLVPLSKTGKPRLITLNTQAIELLRSISPTPDNPYVFPSPATGRPSPSLHFPWARIRRKANLPGVRLHDLRHSFASFLVNGGVSLYVVQNLLGHSQARTTQRYAHLSRNTLSEAAELVGKTVGAAL